MSFLPVAFFAFGPYNKHINSKGAANTNPVRSAFCFIKSPTYLRDDTTEEKEFGKYGSNRMELYGSKVFNEHEMRERLPSSTYKSLKATIEKGQPLTWK